MSEPHKKKKVRKQKPASPDTPRDHREEEPIEEPLKRIPMSDEFDGSDRLRPHNMAAVDYLLAQSKDLIDSLQKGENIVMELINIVPALMEAVKSYPGLKGIEKKIVVLKVIRSILSEIEMAEETHMAVELAVNVFIPGAIDMIVAAADGKYDLGRKWRGVKKAWNLMIGCCGCACCRSACMCT